ncbi:hypothetical protein LXL04_014286 [Taraxacum kok-saghyz]
MDAIISSVPHTSHSTIHTRHPTSSVKMDAPPSLSSAIIRNFDQQQPQVNEPYQVAEDQSNSPSISDIRSMEDQSQSQYNQLFKAINLDRAIAKPMEPYDDAVQPVSIGAMAIRREEIQQHQFPDQLTGISDNSEQAPSVGSLVRNGESYKVGGGNLTYDAPPSRTDVAHRDESNPGESSGGDQYDPEEDYEGVSLTGRSNKCQSANVFKNQGNRTDVMRFINCFIGFSNANANTNNRIVDEAFSLLHAWSIKSGITSLRLRLYWSSKSSNDDVSSFD